MHVAWQGPLEPAAQAARISNPQSTIRNSLARIVLNFSRLILPIIWRFWCVKMTCLEWYCIKTDKTKNRRTAHAGG